MKIDIEDNYTLKILCAFNYNTDISNLTTSLIKDIFEIYRYIEPDHFPGELIIFKTFDDSDIFESLKKEVKYDKNFLINNISDQIIIQVCNDGTIKLFLERQDLSELFISDKALFYYYKNREECFHANNKKIIINKTCDTASIYSLKYYELVDALEFYKINMVRYSSCYILNNMWFDKNRIFFKSSGSGNNEPEVHIHKSLENFLKSTLRDVDVQIVREQTVGSSKSVDIKVNWREANRAALIEVKWLGQACNEESGKITSNFSATRVTEGCVQLKNYLDLERQDTSISITKGYLVVLDGRRKNVQEGMEIICRNDGIYYFNNDLSSYYNKFVDENFNFEKPIIMFAEPICG